MIDQTTAPDPHATQPLPGLRPPALASLLVDHMKRIDADVTALDSTVDGMHQQAGRELAALRTLALGVLLFVAVEVLLNAAMLILIGALVGRR